MQHAKSIQTLIFIFLFLFFSVQKTFTQCISYTLPDTFNVCQSAPLEILITNSNGSNMENINISVEFTTESGISCGLRYVAGTVNGGMESNISNLENPVFSMADLADGESKILCLEIFAPCSAGDCIDNAELFKNVISLTSSNCDEQVSTLPYEIRTARLVITNIANTFLSGSQGNILNRKITIQNTRQGSLDKFMFLDEHQGGINITTNEGNLVFSNYNTWQIELDKDDFLDQGIGETFDFNESFVINENILVLACGYDTTSTISDIVVDWGCDNQVCQMETGTGIVEIQPTDLIPELVFEPSIEIPECFCGPDPVTQSMQITNIGDGSAFDFVLKIDQISPMGRIDLTSFRMDSAGIIIPLESPTLSSAFLPFPDCLLPDSLSKLVDIQIPQLSPGAFVTVFWDVYFCQEGCNQPGEMWSYRYEYNKLCPPDQFYELPDTILVFENKEGIKTNLKINTTPLLDDQTYTVFYKVNYDELLNIDDSLVLEIYLPCGLYWDNGNTLELNGQTPNIQGPITVGDSTLFIAKYDLPFSSSIDSTQFSFEVNCEDFCFDTCRDSLATSCMGIDSCTVVTKLGVSIPINTFIQNCDPTSYQCGIGSCNTLTLPQECYDSVCVKPISGYVSMEFDAERITYGLEDSDNDHFPDGPSPNLNLIRKDRLIIGDTIGTSLKGIVITEDPNESFSEGYIDIGFSGADLGFINTGLISPTGILASFANLKVYDASENTWYECDDLNPIVRDSPLRYSYKLTGNTLIDCGAPSDFVLENGDSILFEGGYQINYNLIRVDPQLVGWQLMGLLTVNPSIPIYNNPTGMPVERDTLFECGCSKEIFEVSGIDLRIEPGVFAIPPCDTSELVGASLLQIQLQFPNFFPYEYRNVTKILEWQLKMPNGVQPVDALLKYIRFQDGLNYLAEKPITPTLDGNNFNYNLSNFQEPNPPEEGFLALLQYRFIGNCMVSGTFNMPICAKLDFNDEMNNLLDTFLVTDPGTNALRALIPNLVLIDTFCIDTTAGNQNVLDFQIYNIQTTISSQQSDTAQNVWLYPTSPSGDIYDFEVINMNTGVSMPTINGIFQLDQIPPDDTLQIQLIALNENCENEELTLQYGWNCTPFTNPINLPCYSQEKTYEVITFPGVLDMFVKSPDDCSDLCDTIPYHQIQIFNADRGSVFDLMVTGNIPPGVGVISNSSEIEYPAGSGNFSPISDPIILGGNKVKWNVIDELLGFDRAPFNAVNLRFLGMDSCSFVSGGFPIFTAFGMQNCGIPTNSIAESGDPLCTNGVSPPYTSTIEVEESLQIECNDIVDFTVSIETTGLTQTGDCIIVNFPPGIEYIENSCSPFLPFVCDCVYENSQLSCTMPPGVSAGSLIGFEFQAEGFSNLGCEPEFLSFQTASQTIANCIAIDDSCSTKVGTGFLLYELDIERPIFELSNFHINAFQTGGNDLVEFSIDVTNQGNADALPPIIIDFYLDTDGDGVGDTQVSSSTISGIINEGAITTLTGNFEVPIGNLCNLIALIDAEKHCQCGVDEIPAQAPFIYNLEETFITCSAGIIEIGIQPEIGNDYQWSGDNLDLLECPTCPLTNFFKINDNGNFQADTLNYLLTCSDNLGCIIQNKITVIVQPEPGIIFATSPICPGEPVNICASDAVSYFWFGSGIVQGEQCQTVFPTQTSVYSVVLVDAEGCTGTDTTIIIVNDLPDVYAGNDTIFCPADFYQINASFNDNYQYSWSVGMPYLNDSTVFNPVILQEIDTTLILVVTDENGCQNFDDIEVSFVTAPDISISPNIDTICQGDVISLVASGANSFQWFPEENCLNNDCSIMEVSPQNTTTYLIIGSNSENCTDTTSVTIVVEQDTTIFEVPEEICENDSTLIFGNWVNQAGTYCDTLILNSGCTSLTCIDLIVLPISETNLQETICQGESIELGNSTYTESGNYIDILTSQNGCDSIVMLDLTVNDIPPIILNGPTEVPLGEPVDLAVQDIYDTYEWLANDEELNDCFGSPDCTHDFPEETTIYTIFVSRGMCTDSASLAVTVLSFCDVTDVQIPNAFTPDGDEINDTFSVVELEDGNNIRLISMEIWSRWGEKIYEGTGANAFWDGTYKDEVAASDVYVYVIWIGCSNGDNNLKRYVGDVTVLR